MDNSLNLHQIKQLKDYLQISKDRFFTCLENNLNQYVNDRTAAYNFINKELNTYDGKSKTHKFTNFVTIFSVFKSIF